MDDIYKIFYKKAQEQPERCFIHFEGRHETFQTIGTSVASVANYLNKTAPEETFIGLYAPNVPSFIVGFYGILAAGKTVVPLNYLFQASETMHVLKHAEVKTVLYSMGLTDRIKEVKKEHGGSKIRIGIIESIVTDSPTLRLAEPPFAQETAVLMYTSGTTGHPKGVMLTQDNLISNAEASIEAFQFDSKHEFISVLPLFHAFGLTTIVLVATMLGATIRLMPKFHPLAVLKEFNAVKKGVFFGVPAMFNLLGRIHNPGGVDASGMLFCVSGSAALPLTVKRQFEKVYGFPVLEGYGLTETSPVVSCNLPGADRAGSVGKPLPGVQVEIRDHGRRVPAGEVGQVVVEGRNVMAGYYKDTEATIEMLAEECRLMTGDLGRLDKDGYLYIVGRLKDMFITGGEKIYPREVEEFLQSLPKVAEASLVAVPHSLKGEVGFAFLQPEQGQKLKLDDIWEQCREHLARYKIPTEIAVLEQLPRNTIGKIDKVKLRETARTIIEKS